VRPVITSVIGRSLWGEKSTEGHTWRPYPSVRLSIRPSVHLPSNSDWNVCRIFTKFRIVVLYIKFCTMHEFLKNRRICRHTWRKRVNEYLLAISIFIERFELNSGSTICILCRSPATSFVKIGEVRNILYFRVWKKFCPFSILFHQICL